MDKRKVFLNDKDYIRFITSMREFNRIKPIGSLYHKNKQARQGIRNPLGVSDSCDKIVEIICYCLNPNHYHFILKQLRDNGITEFMRKVGIGYTNYFNNKYNHSGYLFQGKFKSIHIDSNEYLTLLSAYINLNPKLHKTTSNLNNYPWSSYLDYINKRQGTLCNKEIILSQFTHKNYTYKNFIDTCLPEMKSRKELQKYFIEK
ncbi:MAG: transposase [Parcubacteria group bacterium]|nr:transposase [Parcubacteria group bacterium]